MLKWSHAASYRNIGKLTNKQWNISSLTEIALNKNVARSHRERVEKAWIAIDLGSKKIISHEH